MIRRCNDCGQLFGSPEVWLAHHGQRGCTKRLDLKGYWKGWAGVWWSRNQLFPETEDWAKADLQALDFIDAELV